MDKKQRKIILKLSEKHGLDKAEVEKIITTFFRKVRSELESGVQDNFEDLKTVRIPKFGALYPNEGKFNNIIKNKKKKKNGGQD